MCTNHSTITGTFSGGCLVEVSELSKSSKFAFSFNLKMLEIRMLIAHTFTA